MSGSAWSVTYQFAGLHPSGTYTIKVAAEDAVGNAATASVGTIRLDGRPASLDVELSAIAGQQVISETTTLVGVLSEQANWSGELLKYHFEETSGTSFDDSGSLEFDASCAGAACPTSVSGLFGQARVFDGVNDTLTIANTTTLELTEGTFSAWIKPTWAAGALGYNPAILALRDGSGARYSWHVNRNYGTLELYNGNTVGSVPLALVANQWAHVALVQTGSAWTGYVNGVPVGTVSQAFGSAAGKPLRIGSSTGTSEFFPGQIDELAIYDRPLSEEEIYALAQSRLAGIAGAQVWLEPINLTDPISDTRASYGFEEPAGDFTFNNAAGDTPPARCTSCPAVATGLFGQALSFDGSDILDTGAGLAELGQGSFTLGAWVQTTGTQQTILLKGDGDSAWRTGERSLYLDSSGRPTFVGWGNNSIYGTLAVNDGSWHHVAVTWAYPPASGSPGGSSGTGTMYVDGVDVTNRATTNYAANNADNSADTLRIGQTNSLPTEVNANFSGLLDEVVVYDRALGPAEVALLASRADAATWQSVALSTASGLASAWSYALPANVENTYQIHMRSSDTNGNVSAASTIWRGVIDTRAPMISGTARLLGGGVFAQTAYTISAADFFLDSTRFVHPCAAAEVVLTDGDTPTQTTGASVSCTVSGWPQTLPAVSVCDVAGHCTTAQVTAAAVGDQSVIGILSPDDGASFGTGASISISGGAYDQQGIQKIVISAGSTPIQTFTYNAGLTETLWSTSWSPAAAGVYNITAAMTDQAGNTLTDTISLTIATSTYTLTVATSGSGAGTVTSSPAGIDCGLTCLASFNYGTVITLTATPIAGSSFTGWAGACAGSGSCVITLSQARSVSATFTLNSVTPTATPVTPTATATVPTATATVPTATATVPTATATVPTATAGTPTVTPTLRYVYLPMIVN